MTLLDTEPLDGVDYKNGVLGYITLVSIWSSSAARGFVYPLGLISR